MRTSRTPSPSSSLNFDSTLDKVRVNTTSSATKPEALAKGAPKPWRLAPVNR